MLPVNCVPNETKKYFAINRSNGCKSIKVLQVRAAFLLSRVAEGLPDKPTTLICWSIEEGRSTSFTWLSLAGRTCW